MCFKYIEKYKKYIKKNTLEVYKIYINEIMN